MFKRFTELSGWGRFPKSNCYVLRPERDRDFIPPNTPSIARGLGRSYGDAAQLRDKDVFLTERLSRFLSFDQESGVLEAEGGVSIKEVCDHFIPRGFFPPVVPGTKFVTLAGALAMDVHGKNHHKEGSFSDYVREIKLASSGSIRVFSKESDQALFLATAAGMGLTGFIKEIKLALKRIETAYIKVKHEPVSSLDEVFSSFEKNQKSTYSVAWLSGFKEDKAIVMLGEHALKEDLSGQPALFSKHRRALPAPYLPSFILLHAPISFFNKLYYNVQKRKNQPFLIDYDAYFFPLDALKDWNRLYGARGFLQYQCVGPKEMIALVLDEVKKQGFFSTLSVLKEMGPENGAYLSFPKKGYTLAMDFPYHENLFSLLDCLDQIVLDFEGRVYLAKDARMKSAHLPKMYPRLRQFQRVKQAIDPHSLFQSDLSRRLKIVDL